MSTAFATTPSVESRTVTVNGVPTVVTAEAGEKERLAAWLTFGRAPTAKKNTAVRLNARCFIVFAIERF
ncbi:MAG: hypothetical protein WC802_03400 [Patescibacteria group bacterium]